jgi:hypothetical protein
MTTDTCGFCGFNITTNNNRFAKRVRTTQGEMLMCGNCQDRAHDDFLLKQAPDSPLARNIIAKRRREIANQKKRLNSLIKFHKLSSEKI